MPGFSSNDQIIEALSLGQKFDATLEKTLTQQQQQ